MIIKVQEYMREDGSVPFARWLKKLNHHAAAKVITALARLELGNTSNIKWFSGIGEYKINWGAGYRIYLLLDGNELIILLGGGTKESQQNDIQQAVSLAKEYKLRKRVRQ